MQYPLNYPFTTIHTLILMKIALLSAFLGTMSLMSIPQMSSNMSKQVVCQTKI